MGFQPVSCVHRGETYGGEFSVAGEAADQVVRVRFRGRNLEGPVREGLPHAAAQDLLSELVILEEVRLKVEAGTGRTTPFPDAEAIAKRRTDQDLAAALNAPTTAAGSGAAPVAA